MTAAGAASGRVGGADQPRPLGDAKTAQEKTAELVAAVQRFAKTT